jgi:hypothetical protein
MGLVKPQMVAGRLHALDLAGLDRSAQWRAWGQRTGQETAIAEVGEDHRSMVWGDRAWGRGGT